MLQALAGDLLDGAQRVALDREYPSCSTMRFEMIGGANRPIASP
jgi:hypothetical protein